MDVKLKDVTIKELIENYENNYESGVFGFNKKLNIRPPYQREFVYDPKEQAEVIRTVMKNYPLNVMYWADNENGTFEIIDGQQRTMSICEYANSKFSVEFEKNKPLNFNNLPDDLQNKFLNYKLTVYICTGTDSEKLDWFKVINIAGKPLTPQELRNAIYSGSWVMDAKKYFSKNRAVQKQFSDYLTGSAERQEYLETAIEWISDYERCSSIEQYMADHQHDENASELYQYFQQVFAWVKMVFRNQDKSRIKLMKGLKWGIYYNQYKDNKYNAEDLEKQITALIDDDEVEKKSGIYLYLLSGNEKYLNLRTFSDKDKQKMYQEQNGICRCCNNHFEFPDMDADHIIPWSKGGKTILDNGQMLCRKCNQAKSSK